MRPICNLQLQQPVHRRVMPLYQRRIDPTITQQCGRRKRSRELPPRNSYRKHRSIMSRFTPATHMVRSDEMWRFPGAFGIYKNMTILSIS